MKLNVSIDLDSIWADDYESLAETIREAIKDELVKAARKAVREAMAEADQKIRDGMKKRTSEVVRMAMDNWR